MKLKETFLRCFTVLVLFAMTTACETSDDFSATASVELPPFETMALDFDHFTDQPSSVAKAAQFNLQANWTYPKILIGVWNTALYTTLAIPVATFKTAFNHTPELLDNGIWQWSYTVDGFSSQYTARLTASVNGNTVDWSMYVTKSGVGSFDEFLWFTGNSTIDGTAGIWILNESPDKPNPMLQIDWARENDEVKNVRYTWIRTENNLGQPDLFNSSFLSYGKLDAELDVYYTIHAYDFNTHIFNDVSIEWSSTEYNGRVKAPSYFLDQAWHCWDSDGNDIDCE